MSGGGAGQTVLKVAWLLLILFEGGAGSQKKLAAPEKK